MLNREQQLELARKMAIEPRTLLGLVMMCGYACKATDWLLYHNMPLTKESYRSLINEFQPKVESDVGMKHFLFRELYFGAQEVLRLVNWNDTNS